MRRIWLIFAAFVVLASSCGSDASTAEPLPVVDDATATCLAGDPDCQDVGADLATPPLDSIELTDPEGPIAISFGGFFYADDETIRLCDSLAESFPPQCGSTIIELEATLDLALEHVAEAFGDPDDSRIMNEQGVWWTEDWVNISGLLEAGRLVLS